MLIYKNFGELKNAPKEIYKYFLEMESHEPPVDERDFMEYYGGYVCVLEHAHELTEIPTTVEAIGENRWKSLAEVPDSFDACRWIADGKYVEVYMATTDAGGASYFIPLDIAAFNPNVQKSIEMSNETWKSSSDAD
jgi:hypothetical protein